MANRKGKQTERRREGDKENKIKIRSVGRNASGFVMGLKVAVRLGAFGPFWVWVPACFWILSKV